MRKLLLILIALSSSACLSSQISYNAIVQDGLFKLSGIELTPNEVSHINENAELLLIFNEVNNLPCLHPVVCVYVMEGNDKPANKFKISILDDEGNYTYTSQHKRESSSIWVDETIDGVIGYDIVIHKKTKISKNERDAAEHIEINHNECSFIFRKMIISAK